MILLAYASQYGSTAEISNAIAEALQELQVEVKSVRDVQDVSNYEAVIVGGPMILGWHHDAMNFLQQHRDALRQKPVAYFVVCVSFTRPAYGEVQGVPLYLDPDLGQPPKREDKLSFREKRTTAETYIGPALNKFPEIKPISIAFFGGVVDNSKLSFIAKIFVRFIGAKEGDYRNWEAIRGWGVELASKLPSNQ